MIKEVINSNFKFYIQVFPPCKSLQEWYSPWSKRKENIWSFEGWRMKKEMFTEMQRILIQILVSCLEWSDEEYAWVKILPVNNSTLRLTPIYKFPFHKANKILSLFIFAPLHSTDHHSTHSVLTLCSSSGTKAACVCTAALKSVSLCHT